MGITAQGTKQRLLITTVTETRCLTKSAELAHRTAKIEVTLNFELWFFSEKLDFWCGRVTINGEFSLYGLMQESSAPVNDAQVADY